MSLFSDIESALNSKELKEGWCTYSKAEVLAACILTTRPNVVVEIGVWAGRSLIPMAMACKYVGNGVVIGIDPWSKEASIEGLEGANLEWWSNVAPHEWIYGEFQKALDKFNVRNNVTIHRMKSDDFTPPEHIGLLHVDGSHTVQALRDVTRYCPCVEQGGFCFMDDISWVTSSAANTVDQIKSYGFVERFRFNTALDNGALFQRLQCPTPPP